MSIGIPGSQEQVQSPLELFSEVLGYSITHMGPGSPDPDPKMSRSRGDDPVSVEAPCSRVLIHSLTHRFSGGCVQQENKNPGVPWFGMIHLYDICIYTYIHIYIYSYIDVTYYYGYTILYYIIPYIGEL